VCAWIRLDSCSALVRVACRRARVHGCVNTWEVLRCPSAKSECVNQSITITITSTSEHRHEQIRQQKRNHATKHSQTKMNKVNKHKPQTTHRESSFIVMGGRSVVSASIALRRGATGRSMSLVSRSGSNRLKVIAGAGGGADGLPGAPAGGGVAPPTCGGSAPPPPAPPPGPLLVANPDDVAAAAPAAAPVTPLIASTEEARDAGTPSASSSSSADTALLAVPAAAPAPAPAPSPVSPSADGAAAALRDAMASVKVRARTR
jgi:hypothetical protein